MSRARLLCTGAALIVVVVLSAWTASSAFPLSAAMMQASGPAPPAAQAAARPAQGAQAARQVISSVKATYPPEALGLGLEADVKLRATVDEMGNVVATEMISIRYTKGTDTAAADGVTARLVSKPLPDGGVDIRAQFTSRVADAFVEAASVAARKWKFDPAAEETTCDISFTFRLRPDSARSASARNESASADSSGRGRMATGTPSIGAAPGSTRPGEPLPTPPPSRPSEPLRVGGAIMPPRKVFESKPVYPASAMEQQVQGVVLLEVRIGIDGAVTSARVLRSIPELDQAALDAVNLWRFEPTLLNGVPIEVVMVVTVNFTLA